MEKPAPKSLNPLRRGLLTAVFAVPAAAAAVLLSRRAVQPPAAEPSEEAPQSNYHETDHIRRYYSTLRY